jgi:cytoskeletal protein RodZ
MGERKVRIFEARDHHDLASPVAADPSLTQPHLTAVSSYPREEETAVTGLDDSPFPDRVRSSFAATTADPGPAGQTVGAMLRAERQRQGYDLPTVSTSLRIRAPYLEAIEEGQFGDLPGPTYVVGFIRSYAEFLSLDPKDVLARLKGEEAGSIAKAELYLPRPVPEGRVPGGAILLVCVLLAAAVYGGWYYMSSTGRKLADLVPPLPDRLAGAFESKPTADAKTAEVRVAEQKAPDTKPGELKPSAPAVPPAPPPALTAASPHGAESQPPSSVEPAVGAAPAKSAPPSSVVAALAPPIPPRPAADPTPAPPVSAGPVSAGREPTEELGAEAPRPSASPGSALAAQPPAPPPPVAAAATQTVSASPALPPGGKIYNPNLADSHVQVKVIQDSWVAIRDGNGELVMGRQLRPGDIYRVPDRQGLHMRIGNAGGVFVTIDGVDSPILGVSGQVREIQLDAQHLLKNTAAN